MKTVLQWLKTLPEPHRSRAMLYKNENFYKKCPSLKHALTEFAFWPVTAEGNKYWEAVRDKNYKAATDALFVAMLTDQNIRDVMKKVLKPEPEPTWFFFGTAPQLRQRINFMLNELKNFNIESL